LSGCAGDLSILDPAGPGARQVANLWWVMLAGATVILLGVVGTAIYALRKADRPRTFSDRRVLAGWGLLFPLVTLGALMGYAFFRGDILLPGYDDRQPVIRAHAQQWFWTFEYPGGAQSLQVLHVPEGEHFTLAITSEDVIHSFWVPRLGGKMDAVPGKENFLRLRADEAGVYRGVCAEFCGIGHAHMQLEVHAHPSTAYAEALAEGSDMHLRELPVLTPRPPPASKVIAAWTDYLLDWLGLR
jgi:cytochrome c oxidase subunit II